MFPKKGFKKYGSYFYGEKSCTYDNISLVNGITSGLKTYLGEQQADCSRALPHCKKQSNLVLI